MTMFSETSPKNLLCYRMPEKQKTMDEWKIKIIEEPPEGSIISIEVEDVGEVILKPLTDADGKYIRLRLGFDPDFEPLDFQERSWELEATYVKTVLYGPEHGWKDLLPWDLTYCSQTYKKKED